MQPKYCVESYCRKCKGIYLQYSPREKICEQCFCESKKRKGRRDGFRVDMKVKVKNKQLTHT